MSKRSGAFVVAIGAIAYMSAVSQRSSMGIAALVATDRFHTTASQLSLLAVAQLAVYAAMQIPVGLLLDRFGPRILFTFGALTMAVGQYLVAFSSDLSLAVIGRMLVGFGDAFTFISLIRLINGWYQGKRASQLQQWLGNGGQAGQIISAIPFAGFLHANGWQTSFSVWATISLILGLASWVLIQDEPNPVVHRTIHLKGRIRLLRESIALSSTKMAFWVHFSTQSSTTVIVLLWGVPFLEQAEGYSKPLVAAVLSSFVLIGFAFGVLFGQLCAYRPSWRKPAIVLTSTTMLLSWLLIMSFSGQAPVWVLWVWVVATAMNAPASMVAFDYTRQFVPKNELGAANGFVNIGGFVASFSMMFLIGVTLDLYHRLAGGQLGLPLYSLSGFRLAFIVVILVIGGGVSRYLVNERRTSRVQLAE